MPSPFSLSLSPPFPNGRSSVAFTLEDDSMEASDEPPALQRAFVAQKTLLDAIRKQKELLVAAGFPPSSFRSGKAVSDAFVYHLPPSLSLNLSLSLSLSLSPLVSSLSLYPSLTVAVFIGKRRRAHFV